MTPRVTPTASTASPWATQKEEEDEEADFGLRVDNSSISLANSLVVKSDRGVERGVERGEVEEEVEVVVGVVGGDWDELRGEEDEVGDGGEVGKEDGRRSGGRVVE